MAWGVVLFLASVAGWSAAPSCLPCPQVQCPPSGSCHHGTWTDACGCCTWCTKGPGESCRVGVDQCAAGLVCLGTAADVLGHRGGGEAPAWSASESQEGVAVTSEVLNVVTTASSDVISAVQSSRETSRMTTGAREQPDISRVTEEKATRRPRQVLQPNNDYENYGGRIVDYDSLNVGFAVANNDNAFNQNVNSNLQYRNVGEDIVNNANVYSMNDNFNLNGTEGSFNSDNVYNLNSNRNDYHSVGEDNTNGYNVNNPIYGDVGNGGVDYHNVGEDSVDVGDDSFNNQNVGNLNITSTVNTDKTGNADCKNLGDVKNESNSNHSAVENDRNANVGDDDSADDGISKTSEQPHDAEESTVHVREGADDNAMSAEERSFVSAAREHLHKGVMAVKNITRPNIAKKTKFVVSHIGIPAGAVLAKYVEAGLSTVHQLAGQVAQYTASRMLHMQQDDEEEESDGELPQETSHDDHHHGTFLYPLLVRAARESMSQSQPPLKLNSQKVQTSTRTSQNSKEKSAEVTVVSRLLKESPREAVESVPETQIVSVGTALIHALEQVFGSSGAGERTPVSKEVESLRKIVAALRLHDAAISSNHAPITAVHRRRFFRSVESSDNESRTDMPLKNRARSRLDYIMRRLLASSTWQSGSEAETSLGMKCGRMVLEGKLLCHFIVKASGWLTEMLATLREIRRSAMEDTPRRVADSVVDVGGLLDDDLRAYQREHGNGDLMTSRQNLWYHSPGSHARKARQIQKKRSQRGAQEPLDHSIGVCVVRH